MKVTSRKRKASKRGLPEVATSIGNDVAVIEARSRVLEKLKVMCGVDAGHVATWLPRQLFDAMGPGGDLTLVQELLSELNPRNLLEAMAAVQMIALHTTAMNQLALSRHPDNDTDGINIVLNRATKLLRVSNELMQTWQLLRGKRVSKQNVTVHHVHVGEGAQAIVGAVTSKDGGME